MNDQLNGGNNNLNGYDSYNQMQNDANNNMQPQNINNGLNNNYEGQIINNDQNYNYGDGQVTTVDQNFNNDYNDGSNFYNGNQYVNDSNVIFESSNLSTPQEKVKYFFSTINKQALTFIVATILIGLILLLAIIFFISKRNASYKATVNIPKTVYLGESNSISIVGQGKGNIENMESTIKSENEDIIYVIEQQIKGSNVSATLVPTSEGKTKITVNSKLKNRKMANVSEEVIVCPAFDSSLIANDHISIKKGENQQLNINFGDQECAKGVLYESNNPEVASVDATGAIMGVGSGVATISIKKDNRVLTTTVTVTTDTIAMTDFSISPSTVQMEPGDVVRLKATYSPSDATTYNLSFSDYDNEIISISPGGVIKALKNGVTFIKITSGISSIEKEIPVFVGKDESVNATVVTGLSFEEEQITLIEGTTSKIHALFIPNNVNNKDLKWTSSNEDVVFVKNGTIYGKSIGDATVTAITNNNISKTINVKVKEIPETIITTSDKVESGKWHTDGYELSFYNALNNITFYYGVAEDKTNTAKNSIVISKDESRTYFIKACLNNHCAKPVSYISNVDITLPKVVKITGVPKEPSSQANVKIVMQDEGSLIEKWCVTNSNNSVSCKWNSITKSKNPVAEYVINKNGVYYAFAKDTAGNISEPYKLEITNIN